MKQVTDIRVMNLILMDMSIKYYNERNKYYNIDRCFIM